MSDESPATSGPASPTGDAPAPASELLAVRRAKLDRLRAGGIDPFPHAFAGVTPIADVRAAHAELEAGAETEDRRRVAGRLHARRGQGKMAFLDLDDRSGRLQLQAPGAVIQIQEGHLPLPAAGVQAPGDAATILRLCAGFQLSVSGPHVGDRRDAGERVRERVDPAGAQAVKLGAAHGEQLAGRRGRVTRGRRGSGGCGALVAHGDGSPRARGRSW